MHKLLAVLLGICISGTTAACNLDLGLGGVFNIGRDGSLKIAVAMADARQAGIIQTTKPGDEKALAEFRARLWQMKLKAYQGEKPAFYFYQALDQHWTQISDFFGNTLVSLHQPPRREIEDGVVVMSHGDVMDALLNGSLSLVEAEQKGLVKISGSPGDVIAVRAWMNSALDRTG